MSLKYERVKQADLALPAPLRRLTRAFSSITLAVMLLTLVALYGMLASVPVAFIARGALCGGVVLVVMLAPSLLAAGLLRGEGTLRRTLGWIAGIAVLGLLGFTGAAVIATLAANSFIDRGWPAAPIQAACWLVIAGAAAGQALLVYRFARSRLAGPPRRPAVAAALLAAGWAAGVPACRWVFDETSHAPWFLANKAAVLYRLPYFEMTELEFYSWWPLKLVLFLFVINLIWATIRRIEFKFVNLGVLTVHTGIVTLALGSIFYGRFKVEGDTLLWRADLPHAEPVSRFYDATEPAVYFTRGNRHVMVPLDSLPRYNDYPLGGSHGLNIALHERGGFGEVLGTGLRATIRGFLAYAELQPVWVDARDSGETAAPPNPAVRLALGDRERAGGDFSAVLVAGVPAQRVIDEDGWALEYLAAPSPQRVAELMANFDGEHGLVVEMPGAGFRQVYALSPGETIPVGDTGYTLSVEAIGAYGMSVVTRGYEGVRDTRAVVRVSKGERTFRRIVMHRYPELTQEFTPAPDDPTAGPMGTRGPPSPDINLTYIDASKPQFRLIDHGGPGGKLELMVRFPGHPPFVGALPESANPKFPIIANEVWLHVTERIARAVRVFEPAVTPRNKRNPKDEGTYVNALLPVELSIDLPRSGADGGAAAWKKTVWLPHLRYPDLPTADRRPAVVDIPTIGPVTIAFSRVSHDLPFALELRDFEMQPYPGSQIPRDFVATLAVEDAAPPGTAPSEERVTLAQTKLNNPLMHYSDQGPWMLRKVKLSQTGWDPGEASDPAHGARNADGRFTNQQRFTILGVGNNVAIRVVALGACLIVIGIPWAFYVKPALVQRQKRRLQRQVAASGGRKKELAAR